MLDPALKAALENRHAGRIAILVELNLDSGTLYYSSNYSAVSYNGNNYEYLGALGGVGDIEETTDLQPADYEIVLSGTDLSLISLFINQPIINRGCSVSWALLDDAGDIIGAPVLLFSGLLQPAILTVGGQSTIKIPVRDVMADWDRDLRVLYTNEQQLRDFPDDHCFEDISSSAELEIIWPARSYWD